MPDNGRNIVFKMDADDKEAQKKLDNIRKDIEKTTKALDTTTQQHNGIVEQLQAAQAEAKKTEQTIQEIHAQMAENESVLSGRTGNVDLEEYEARKQAQAEMSEELKTQNALYEKQTKTVSTLEGKEKGLLDKKKQQTAQLEHLRVSEEETTANMVTQGNRAMPQIGKAAEAASKSFNKGLKNILKWGFGIRSVFILVRRLRSAIKEGITEYAKGDAETKANLDGLKKSLATLKVSWGAAFAPIVNAVAPLLQKLIGWLTTAANAVNQFFAAIGGRKTYRKAIANNNALADSYSGAGSAAKEAEKQLLGFDEINKLNANENGGGGGGSGSATDYEDVDVSTGIQRIATQIKENLPAVEFAVGTSLLALGAILTFSGANIPLGLGLMAIGAYTLGKSIKENWSSLSPSVQSAVMEITTLLGVSLLAIGAILAFSGANIPLGIGLMAAGAASLAAVALNWGNLSASVQRTITEIMIALGASLLVVGAILAASGVNIPVGIALMAIGAASVWGAVGLNWNTLKTQLSGTLGALMMIAGGFLAVIGLILLLTGVGIPLGIGMLLAGGAAFGVGAAYYDWDGLLKKIQEAWGRLKSWWNRNVAKYFTLEYWQQKVNDAFGRIRFPHINLPHISISWEAASGWIANALSFFGIPTAVPHINVAWYAKGGIVDGATLIGAGEAGKEAIIPLEQHTEWITMVADSLIDRIIDSNKLRDYVSNMPLPAIATGTIVPPRSINSSGSMFSDGDIERLVNGITAALSADTSGEQSVKLFLDGRQIAETVTKHQRRMNRGLA